MELNNKPESTAALPNAPASSTESMTTTTLSNVPASATESISTTALSQVPASSTGLMTTPALPQASQSSTAEKRQLSHSSSSSVSPLFKRSFVLDGQETDVSFDSDSPYWVPLIFKALDTVNNNVESLTSTLHAYEQHKQETDARISYLEKQVHYDQLVIQHLLKRDDIQETYSSRECLLLHGVKENDKEDTDLVVVEKVNTNLNLIVSLRVCFKV